MGPFALLADPIRHVSSDWDLSRDEDGRIHWVDLFKQHFRTILKLGIDMALARGGHIAEAQNQADRCAADFDAAMDAFAARPGEFGRVTIITLDNWRDQTLRRHGYVDAFLDLKNRENERMLPLLPVVCAQLDALADESERFRAVIEGVFAGNIFDMGATATAKAFMKQSPDFFGIRQTLTPRPWLADDYDALEARLLDGPPYRKAVFFIDNAGSDFLLGALPLARWLAKRGTRIVLAANERPSLNDMTVHDVRDWWPRIVETEPSLRDCAIDIVTTGTGEPLIDLCEVSDELNAVSADADLVILEGMGRGVESNFDAILSVDSLKIAMLKDPAVAKRIGGKVFDLVCRFTESTSSGRSTFS
jgi:type II pantothenate kinase